MAALVVAFVFLAAVIVVAGAFLSRSADDIAEITGLGRLLVGSILLAGATSLPEITVDIACVRQGNPDLAVGDLLGSCLMNLLILAVLDLTNHSRGRMFSRTAAGHALGGIASISLAAILLVGMLVERQTKVHEWFGLAPGCLMIIIAYVLSIRMITLDQQIATRSVEGTTAHKSALNYRELARPVLVFAVASLAILLAGPRLSVVADKIAEHSGLAKTFVGTTLVAITTSLPELVTCWVAVRLGQLDLAIGNIFGSNAFNLLILAALDTLQPGSLLSVISPVHGITAAFMILGTSVSIMGQLYHVEKRCWILEPDATIVILLVVGSFGLIYAVS